MHFLGCCDVSLWVLLPGICLIVVCVYTCYKRVVFARLGYPCARTWPFIGDIPGMVRDGIKQHQVNSLRENGKVFGTFVGNVGSLVVAEPEMIKEMFVKEFASFPIRENIGKLRKYSEFTVSNAEGDHWKFLRNAVSPTFTTGKLKRMVPLIEKCLDTFVDRVEEQMSQSLSTTVDLQDLFGALTMDVICKTALGVDVDSQRNPDDSFVKHAKRAMNMLSGLTGPLLFLFPEITPVLQKLGVKFFDDDAMDFLTAAVREAMVTRRKEDGVGRTDALQVMLNSQIRQDTDEYKSSDRGMSDDEITANAVMFLLGGYDTTASALTWIAYCLATNPDVQERLVEEIDREVGVGKPTYDSIGRMQYLDMVVSETLRLFPPAPTITRHAVADVEICGYRIPRGLMVTVPVYGLHRLEEYWPDPDTYDPERFSTENKKKMNAYTYLPFGMGPRNCVAMKLGLMEAKMATVTLVQHFRLSPSEATDIPPKFSPAIFTRPANGMQLKVEKRRLYS